MTSNGNTSRRFTVLIPLELRSNSALSPLSISSLHLSARLVQQSLPNVSQNDNFFAAIGAAPPRLGDERFSFAVGQAVSRRIASAGVVQPRSTRPSHVGRGGRCCLLGDDDFWWHLHRDWLGDRAGLFPTTMGSPSVKPRDRFTTFLIHTHLRTRLAAPIGKHLGQCVNTFGMRP